MHDRFPLKRMCSRSPDHFKFGYIGVIISKTVQDRQIFALED